MTANLDGRHVVAVTEGRGRGAPTRLCDQHQARGGDRSAVTEVTRDVAAPSLGAAPTSCRPPPETVDCFHVV